MWYNTIIAANKLNITRQTVYNLVKKGYLQSKQGPEGIMVWIPLNAILDRDKSGFKLSFKFK